MEFDSAGDRTARIMRGACPALECHSFSLYDDYNPLPASKFERCPDISSQI
jgi:hypothetical protein